MQLAKEQARVHESRYRMASTQVAGTCRGFEVTIASKSEATPAASAASGRHGCTVGELPAVGRSPTRACRWSLERCYKTLATAGARLLRDQDVDQASTFRRPVIWPRLSTARMLSISAGARVASITHEVAMTMVRDAK